MSENQKAYEQMNKCLTTPHHENYINHWVPHKGLIPDPPGKNRHTSYIYNRYRLVNFTGDHRSPTLEKTSVAHANLLLLNLFKFFL